MRTHAMGEMTVKEIREYLKTNQTIILPYGVVEQHGYHLPLSMDIHNAEVPSYALAEKLGCIVAPPLNYCFSGGQLPGTINVRPTTFCAMVCDIVESLANQGFLNILIFPGHGGTESLDQLRESLRILKWLNPALEKVMIEPGRSIVAEAGMTLYTVGFGKQTPNRTYVFVDGGMSDNIRPALYQAAYSCDVANRMDEEKRIPVCVAGKCCESGDVLIEEAMLPPCVPGDLLIVYSTGAYGFSMASHYNRLCRPAVVFVKDGKARCVVRRETYADLLKGECGE